MAELLNDFFSYNQVSTVQVSLQTMIFTYWLYILILDCCLLYTQHFLSSIYSIWQDMFQLFWPVERKKYD